MDDEKQDEHPVDEEVVIEEHRADDRNIGEEGYPHAVDPLWGIQGLDVGQNPRTHQRGETEGKEVDHDTGDDLIDMELDRQPG